MFSIERDSPTKHFAESTKYEYSQIDMLGHGAFGTVFKGKNKITGEPVALKFIERNSPDTNFHQQLRSEIETLRRVSQIQSEDFDLIIKLKDYYETTRHFVIVTELFADSMNLQQYLEKKKLSEDDALDILYQITRAISVLHKLQIAHRDLKPANILIRGSEIKIIDFGFAKQYSEGITHNTAGSPIYMSPQNIFHLPYNAFANDVWSIGIIFYQMVTGQFPWNVKNVEQLDQALQDQIENQLELNCRNLSGFGKEIVHDCLRIPEAERVNIHQLNYKVGRIIESIIKLSYEHTLQLPRFKWDRIAQYKPIIKGYISDADLY